MIKKDNIIEHYKQLWNTEEDKKIWNKADRRISKITQEEYLKYLDECKYGDSEKKQKFENFIKSFASQQIIENLKTTTTMKDYKISSSYDKSGGVEKQL